MSGGPWTLSSASGGGGGTELLPAFTRALHLKKKEGYCRTVVIATDGYVTVEEEVFDLIRGNLDKTNVFAFGIGTSVNRHLMEGMARVGMGESFIITRPEEAALVAGRFRKMIQFPVLTGIDLKVDSFSAYDIEPLRIPDILAERPVILFGKYRGKPQGAITITGRSGEGPFRERIDIGKSHPSKGNAALRYLWARHRIALLSDYENLHSSDRRIKEVTDLGLGYNLLTRYTSFVAIDSEVRNKNGRLETVKQPLPLPQGVSDYAVGRQGGLAGAGYAMRAKVAHDAYGAAPLAVPPSPVQETAQNFGTEKKKEGIAPKLNLKHVAVSAGLSGPSVSGLVQENLHALESCMSRAITGEVVVKMTIGKDGAVSRLVFSGLSREIAQCWEREIRTWHFPRPGSGREENATLSFKWA